MKNGFALWLNRLFQMLLNILQKEWLRLKWMGKQSTGMGLALCKKISEALSIKIEIYSEKGKGTEVRLIIKPYKNVSL